MTTRMAGFIRGAALAAALAVAVPASINAWETDEPKHEEDGHGEGHADEVELSEQAIRVFGIRMETVSSKTLEDLARVPARVAFNGEAMAHVGTPLEGRVAEIVVRLGDDVAKGAVLVIIDSPELGEAQGDFLQKRSGVEVAESAVEVARLNHERAQKLREANGISVTDLLQRQGDLKRAEGELKVAGAALLAAENKLHLLGISQEQVDALKLTGEISTRFEVHAPFAGRVVAREVTPGEIVGPDRESLMVIADVSTMWVLADLPERQVPRVQIGTKARVTLGAMPHAPIEGSVAFVATHLDSRTRTGQVRIVVETSDSPSSRGAASGIKPGMFGEAEFTLAAESGQSSAPVLAVLETAIQTVEGSDAVFVPADEPNSFAKRSVSVGPRVGVWVPVLSGLKEGEAYVATGSFILKAELGKEGASHEH